MQLSNFFYAVCLMLLDGSDAEVPALDKVYYSILEKKFDALAERVGILESTVQDQTRIIGSENELITLLEKTVRKYAVLLEAQGGQ